MNRKMPAIEESADQLRRLLSREQDGQKKQRLQALYLVASGQATRIKEVASLVGVHRNTVGSWLRLYEAGGLAGLLTIKVPPGPVPTLTADQMRQLEQALAHPEGFASYEAIQQWIATELGVTMPYKTVYHIVRYRLRAKAKRPRPSHVKKGLSGSSLLAPASGAVTGGTPPGGGTAHSAVGDG